MSNGQDYERGRHFATLATVQASLDRNERSMRRLERRLFGDDDGDDGVIGRHERKIRALENWRNYLAGAGALIATWLGVNHR